MTSESERRERRRRHRLRMMAERELQQSGGGERPFVTPADVSQIAAGYWWDSEVYTDLGASNFNWSELSWGAVREHYQVQTTPANQPVPVAENGIYQFEFANSWAPAPTTVKSPTDNQRSHWTGATWLAMWSEFPDGVTGTNTLFRMSGGAGQRRIIAQRTATDYRLSLSNDGNGSFTYTWPAGPDADQHFLEFIFRPSAASTLRGELWIDRAPADRAASPSIGTTLFDPIRAIYIGNAAGIANPDRAKYGMVYYGNGIPSDSRIELLYRYKAPKLIP